MKSKDVIMESIQKNDIFSLRLCLHTMYCLQEFTRIYKFWKIWGFCGIWSPVRPFTAVLNLCHSDANGNWTLSYYRTALWDTQQSSLRGFGHSHHTRTHTAKGIWTHENKWVQTRSYILVQGKGYLWRHHVCFLNPTGYLHAYTNFM